MQRTLGSTASAPACCRSSAQTSRWLSAYSRSSSMRTDCPRQPFHHHAHAHAGESKVIPRRARLTPSHGVIGVLTQHKHKSHTITHNHTQSRTHNHTQSPPHLACIPLCRRRLIARPMYSNPPVHGALIVSEVLNDATLRAQYYKECKGMADRINEMRARLKAELTAAGSKHDWSHVTSQVRASAPHTAHSI